MSEREMLERAAAAAGIKVIRSRLDDPSCKDLLVENSPRNQLGDLGPWNPLTDDGDALRLAVRLALNVEAQTHGGVMCFVSSIYGGPPIRELLGDDPYAATRLAITRAAAALAPTAQGE